MFQRQLGIAVDVISDGQRCRIEADDEQQECQIERRRPVDDPATGGITTAFSRRMMPARLSSLTTMDNRKRRMAHHITIPSGRSIRTPSAGTSLPMSVSRCVYSRATA